jgi:hypothetical protein
MPDYEIRVVIRDVARGDVVHVADDIWARHAEGLDAKLGDFDIQLSELDPKTRVRFSMEYVPPE